MSARKQLKTYIVYFRAIFPNGCYDVRHICTANNEEEVDGMIREKYARHFDENLVRGYTMKEVTFKGIIASLARASPLEDSFIESTRTKDKEWLALYHQNEEGHWVVSTAKEMLKLRGELE